jgi:hypothetical protein
MRTPSIVVVLLCVGAPAAAPLQAQTLADLQPGRNFAGSLHFGSGRSENIDPGDCDNDGDLDVIIANGGDGAPQLDRIYVNQGGLQAGAIGTFADESATRFAGMPSDTSRDIEFVDFEHDGDLDIYVANRGTNAEGGAPSRLYANLGGAQAGTIGFYLEETNARWGTLVSVPAGDQVLGGNQGPFKGFTCDCDFADLDDDGDSDLFHSSYGPGIDGTRASLVFLNDGAGVFHELSPWSNASADIKTHTFDLDLVDLDGDYDIDVAVSSRNSQARVHLNNLRNPLPGATTPFTDITQTAYYATFATGSASVNYTNEYADVDGDGDFDVWQLNYDGNLDRILRNNGLAAGAPTFTEMGAWVKSDPSMDEMELDFIDYDADGDLDAFAANFSGTDWLYQSGLAQGLAYGTVGLYHRTGVGAGLSPAPETSITNNGSTTLDADAADIDNDGDEDIVVANDSNQGNVLHRNVKGVPDTHAPTFFLVTAQGDKPDGSDTVIHAQLRDNSAYYLVTFYPTTLRYRVNGGPEQTVEMFAQGSMQFRGVIPAQTDATVSYHVETADLAGNVAVSPETCFQQGSPASPWTDLGGGLPGVSGIPSLTGTGPLCALCPLTLTLTSARPASSALLFMSLTSSPFAWKGGVLVAFPPLPPFPLTLPTGTGTIGLASALPFGINGLGLELFFQYAVVDAAAVQGWAFSNTVNGNVP